MSEAKLFNDRMPRKTGTEGFDKWWSMYPAHRRVAKSRCLRYWTQYKLEERWEDIVWALYRHRWSVQWSKGFIPLSTTWLSQQRWEQDLEQLPSSDPTPEAVDAAIAWVRNAKRG